QAWGNVRSVTERLCSHPRHPRLRSAAVQGADGEEMGNRNRGRSNQAAGGSPISVEKEHTALLGSGRLGTWWSGWRSWEIPAVDRFLSGPF
uniref:Uncharacterized protein n=1 Tax=Apteryx owenii TaxID=8824 RepID=A0A8B9PFW9_APTOW